MHRTVHYIQCDECEKELSLVSADERLTGWRQNSGKDFCSLDCEITYLQRLKKQADCPHKNVTDNRVGGWGGYTMPTVGVCQDCGKSGVPIGFSSGRYPVFEGG